MTATRPITLYYSPQTRASGTRIILEELGAPYTLQVLNRKLGELHRPEFLAINPLGKVPAIRHGEVVVTEQIAIALHLGDLFPDAGLTPAIDDPDRGPYLRWMVYYAASFEPALIDKWRGIAQDAPERSPYRDYDSMLGALEAQIARGPYILGERLTLADIQWGVALAWTTMFGLVPKTPVIAAYIERITARPSFQKVWADDAVMAAELDKAAAAQAGEAKAAG